MRNRKQYSHMNLLGEITLNNETTYSNYILYNELKYISINLSTRLLVLLLVLTSLTNIDIYVAKY